MTSIFGAWIKSYRAKKQAKIEQTKSLLTVKYQLFRGLLDSNDLAVTLLSELDLFAHSDTSLKELQPQLLRLIDAVDEMIELLIQLGGDHDHLRNKFQFLLAQINKILLPDTPAEPIAETVSLAEISPRMIPEVGNKAASLAELAAEPDFNIPGGFVVPISVCREFLQHNDLYAKINQQLRTYISSDEIPIAVIEKIQSMIREAELPRSLEEAIAERCQPFFRQGKGLAVRSSSGQEDTASHSFAGQYDTVLNVVDRDSTLSAFRQVVASNYNARCLAYRQKAQLARFDFDMAVLFLEMIDAECAGVMLTRSAFQGVDSIIISGTYGLGESVVSGSIPTDLFYLDMQGQVDQSRSIIGKKETRLVCSRQGGIVYESVPREMQQKPVLSAANLQILYQWGKKLETLRHGPQDIEWAFDATGKPVLLQTRPLVITGSESRNRKSHKNPDSLDASISNSSVATGQAFFVRSIQDLNQLPDEPLLLFLRQSIPDVARVMDKVQGLLIEKGNPVDHLALVAREYSVPVLYGLPVETRQDTAGEWLTMNEAQRSVQPATEDEIRQAGQKKKNKRLRKDPRLSYPPGSLGELIFPLHLTDAYGPMFSITECQSLHDIIRYAHEKGVLAMFDAGDYALEKGGLGVHFVDIEAPFLVSVIDLGGGLIASESLGRHISPTVIQSHPLQAILEGICTEGLHWGPIPGAANVGAVMSKWMLDQRSPRPIGMPNYAMITRDYLNLNARMDFHFTMIDSVCGFNPEANHIHFRFNGGGTETSQRNRRAKCIRLILEKHGFFTDLRNDLVNGTIHGGSPELIREKLAVLGRLLGFTRLLDAAMQHDDLIETVVEAFEQGNYQLSGLQIKNPETTGLVEDS